MRVRGAKEGAIDAVVPRGRGRVDVHARGAVELDGVYAWKVAPAAGEDSGRVAVDPGAVSEVGGVVLLGHLLEPCAGDDVALVDEAVEEFSRALYDGDVGDLELVFLWLDVEDHLEGLLVEGHDGGEAGEVEVIVEEVFGDGGKVLVAGEGHEPVDPAEALGALRVRLCRVVGLVVVHGYSGLMNDDSVLSGLDILSHAALLPQPQEDSGEIRCVCDYTDDDGFTILCEKCMTWQHGICVGITADNVPDEYLCVLCTGTTLRIDVERANQLQSARRQAEVNLRNAVPWPSTEPDADQHILAQARDYAVASAVPQRIPSTNTPAAPKRPRRTTSTLKKPRSLSNAPAPSPHSATASPYTLSEDDSAPPGEKCDPWMFQYTPIAENKYRPPSLLQRLIHDLSQSPIPDLTYLPDATIDQDPDAHLQSPFKAVICDSLPSPEKTSVRHIQSSAYALAVPSSTIPSSSSTSSHFGSMPSPYSRPTAYGIFAEGQIAAGAFISTIVGEIRDFSDYKNDPVVQWHTTGAAKTHVHPIPSPASIVIDQRRFADNFRYLRNGCHPNCIIRPILVQDRQHSEHLQFGLFATADIGRRDELVLPWAWDDQHPLHNLPHLLDEAEKEPVHIETFQEAAKLYAECLLTLLSTQSCACTSRKNCAIAWSWIFASHISPAFASLSASSMTSTSGHSGPTTRGATASQPSTLDSERRKRFFDVESLQNMLALTTATEDDARTVGRKSSTKSRLVDFGPLIGRKRCWERAFGPPASVLKQSGRSVFKQNIARESSHSETSKGKSPAPTKVQSPVTEMHLDSPESAHNSSTDSDPDLRAPAHRIRGSRGRARGRGRGRGRVKQNSDSKTSRSPSPVSNHQSSRESSPSSKAAASSPRPSSPKLDLHIEPLEVTADLLPSPSLPNPTPNQEPALPSISDQKVSEDVESPRTKDEPDPFDFSQTKSASLPDQISTPQESHSTPQEPAQTPQESTPVPREPTPPPRDPTPPPKPKVKLSFAAYRKRKSELPIKSEDQSDSLADKQDQQTVTQPPLNSMPETIPDSSRFSPPSPFQKAANPPAPEVPALLLAGTTPTTASNAFFPVGPSLAPSWLSTYHESAGPSSGVSSPPLHSPLLETANSEFVSKVTETLQAALPTDSAHVVQPTETELVFSRELSPQSPSRFAEEHGLTPPPRSVSSVPARTCTPPRQAPTGPKAGVFYNSFEHQDSAVPSGPRSLQSNRPYQPVHEPSSSRGAWQHQDNTSARPPRGPFGSGRGSMLPPPTGPRGGYVDQGYRHSGTFEDSRGFNGSGRGRFDGVPRGPSTHSRGYPAGPSRGNYRGRRGRGY